MHHSIYLHIPFCEHRCAYCDFNTYAGVGELIPSYVLALQREVEIVAGNAPADCRVHTVFFGGGTPSLLSAAQVGNVLGTVRSNFQVEAAAEISLEANPGTLTLPALLELRRSGVNRISLGVQSANGEELRMLERTHDFAAVLEAVAAVRRSGFDNLNLDLIYGLPEQSLETWSTTLRRVLRLRPDHISAYCLTLEHGTPFGRWAQRGLMSLPDPDLAADMYELADREFALAGYEQYEISNWALPGKRCRHNLQYWRGEPYLGFGAGAHGYAAGRRYSNVLAIREYIARTGASVHAASAPAQAAPSRATTWITEPTAFPCSPAAVEKRFQSREDDMADFMIMGLRLTDVGVSEVDFGHRFGMGIDEVFGKELVELAASGLLESVDGGVQPRTASDYGDAGPVHRRYRLTKRGRLLGNRVFSEFVN